MIDKKKLQARARKQKQSDNLKAQGLVSVLCWVLPENKQALRGDEKRYREKIEASLNLKTIPFRCFDRMCGANDCQNCHPEYFVNDLYQNE